MLVMGSKALEEEQPRSPVASVPSHVDNRMSKTTGPLLCWMLSTISCHHFNNSWVHLFCRQNKWNYFFVSKCIVDNLVKVASSAWLAWASCPLGVWVIPHVSGSLVQVLRATEGVTYIPSHPLIGLCFIMALWIWMVWCYLYILDITWL